MTGDPQNLDEADPVLDDRLDPSNRQTPRYLLTGRGILPGCTETVSQPNPVDL